MFSLKSINSLSTWFAHSLKTIIQLDQLSIYQSTNSRLFFQFNYISSGCVHVMVSVLCIFVAHIKAISSRFFEHSMANAHHTYNYTNKITAISNIITIKVIIKVHLLRAIMKLFLSEDTNRKLFTRSISLSFPLHLLTRLLAHSNAYIHFHSPCVTMRLVICALAIERFAFFFYHSISFTLL